MTDIPSNRTSRRPRRLWIIAAVVSIAVLVVGGVGVWYVNATRGAVDNISRNPSMMPSEAGRPSEDPVQSSVINILVMGSDSRGDDGEGRSDVLMLVHIPADRSTGYLISFPRDMWVEVPGYGMNKINAAYSYGGMSLAVATVENLTGARIDHSMIVDFTGFKSVIDAVGGITVTNSIASASAGYTFPAGTLTLDGDAALAYVRERKTLPNGDLDRAARQRAVTIAVVKKIVSRDVVTNPVKFTELVSTISPYLTVDEDFTIDLMRDLATTMGADGDQRMRTLQAPLSGFGTSDDGQSIDVVAPVTMAELCNALQTDAMADYYAAHSADPLLGNP